jgi:hypothetical protein
MTKRVDDDEAKRLAEVGYVLGSLASARREEVDPIFGVVPASVGHNAQAMDRAAAGVSTQQGMYLTASGSLIQFNAIMAAIHGSALAIADHTLTKGAFTCALLLHVLAAFVLCWAARPITQAPSPLYSVRPDGA